MRVRAEKEECGDRGQSPRADNRNGLHPPRISRNTLHIWKCNLAIQLWPPSPVFRPVLKLSGTGRWCPKTGSPRRDKTGQDGKASSTPKRCISDIKGGPRVGKHKLCQKAGQCVNRACASVPEVSIKHSFCQLPSLRGQLICHLPSCCFLADLINVPCVT